MKRKFCFRILINERPVVIENNYLDEVKVGVSVHSCIEVEQLKIFGIEMEPIQNSESYESLVTDEDISKTSSLTTGAAPVHHGAKLDVLQRDMYKYKIEKHDQAKFYFQLNFAPKRINLELAGEFELVKIKSNGVNLIRIFIAENQVKVNFHPLYNARNIGLS